MPDGASVMKKTRRSQITHQLCFSHGIHLAVVDVLYKKANDLVEDKDFCSDNVEEHTEEVDGDDNETSFQTSVNWEEL